MQNEVIELQIKLSYLEDLVNGLNDVVARQDKQIQDLQDQLKLMYAYLESGSDGISPFDLLGDKPPHY